MPLGMADAPGLGVLYSQRSWEISKSLGQRSAEQGRARVQGQYTGEGCGSVFADIRGGGDTDVQAASGKFVTASVFSLQRCDAWGPLFLRLRELLGEESGEWGGTWEGNSWKWFKAQSPHSLWEGVLGAWQCCHNLQSCWSDTPPGVEMVFQRESD